MNPRTIHFISIQTIKSPFQWDTQCQAGIEVFITSRNTNAGRNKRLIYSRLCC